MVCGHLDRNALARLVTDLLAGDLANLVTSAEQAPVPGPRCECDEHPPAPRAAIPGALPTTTATATAASQPITTAAGQSAATGLPTAAGQSAATTAAGQPTTIGPVPPGLTGAAAAGTTAPGAGSGAGSSPLTPGGLARLQDTLLRYAVSLLSGPTGLASYLRTQLTGGFFPAPSLPLDLGQPTEQVPPHLRRAVTKRDRHCSFPGCTAPPVRCHVHHVIPRSQGRPDPPGQSDPFVHFSPPDRRAPLGLELAIARRRHHHRDQPRRHQDLAQPRTATRPGHTLD